MESSAPQSSPVYLSSFINEEDILFNMEVPSSYNMIHALVSKLTTNHLSDIAPEPIIDAVLQRERTEATVIGQGVALPHARVAGLERPYLAMGIYPAGIQFSPNQAPVQVVFLLLVPESQPARYLQILRALGLLLREPGTVSQLAQMHTAADIMHFFRRSEMKLPEYICGGDLMTTTVESLHDFDALALALDAFMLRHKIELPIVDSENRLVGIIDTRAMLQCFIPSGIRKIFPFFQTSPTLEPLALRMKATYQMKVCEAMSADVCVCNIDTPAREIAATLAEKNAANCYVLDKDKRLVGVIPVAQFFSRILKD